MAYEIPQNLRSLVPQGQGIEQLITSNRAFSETDARNFAFAAGRQNEWQQFQNITGAQALARLTPATTPELNVNNLSSTTIPSAGRSNINDFISNIAGSSMTNFEKAILELQKQRETLNTQSLDLAKTKREEALVGLEGAMNQGSSLDLFKKLQEEAGIKEKESKLDSILQQINDVKASYEAGKNALVGESATMKLLTGKQERLADQANAQISNLSATGALVQGQLDRAETLVGNYFKFAMDDRQAEIDRRKVLFDLADKNLITLTDEEKKINEDAISFLSSMNERQLKEKDNITALMLDNPEAWQAAANKIDLTKPFEDIAKQLLPYIAAQNQKEFNAIHGGSVSTSTGTFTENDFKNAGVLTQTANGEWAIDYDALSQFYDARGIATKDKNAIVNSISQIADALNSGQQGQSTSDLINQSINSWWTPPSGMTGGQWFGASLRETPSTVKNIVKGNVNKFKKIGGFFGDIGKGLFGN